ncbi:alkaline phosphatase family protein [Myxococcus sp. XM-1-1-1]|uniref:alkaline phosphatase family protein n=1 Tax=Myxococcus sp. XM-1-1-1 TaxID=2874602 RepID=UPI001CBB66D4|nr:alkaline phosphatase family protein [Myxococcus sp. XM-1-1-1]MBZ4414573.1 alkaline phosphatase family protein [Myxococcus sp. XM-1-1-1]
MIRALVLTAVLASLPAAARPPRLTLLITVDALGSDVLLRNRPRLQGGLGQLLDSGAYFPYARYGYAKCRTAPGHTTLATGANPWRHGIVDNRWWDRASGKRVYSFVDPAHPVLEAASKPGQDASPVNLMAETLADRLRMATQQRGKAVSMSLKSRSAIAMAGRLGQAWWFDEDSGKFVTGTWYAKEFPQWLQQFNARKLPDRSFGKTWELSRPRAEYVGEDDLPHEADSYGLGRVFPHPLMGGLKAPGTDFYKAFGVSPDSHEFLVEAAKAAIAGEGLGKDAVPDLLMVSFSGTDNVFHEYGPYSWEMQDTVLRLDKALGELISAAERAAGGRANLSIALVADHGGAAAPEEWAAAGLPAQRMHPKAISEGITAMVKERFGPDVTVAMEELDVYLGGPALASGKVDGAQVRRAVVDWLKKQPIVVAAVTREELFSAPDPAGHLATLRKGYYPERSGDVLYMLAPFQVVYYDAQGSTHGSPYSYDSQVPVVFAGKGVKPGTYMTELDPVDVAPTLAALMEMGMPASTEGKPRAEILTGK